MSLRRSYSLAGLVLAAFVLPLCTIAACAKGSTTFDGEAGGGSGEGGDWGAQSSSSSASGGGAGGSTASSSSSGSSTSSSSSSSSSGGGNGPLPFVVLRIGDGSTALTGASTPGYIEHLRSDGTPTPGKSTVSLPTFASGNNQPLTFSGSASAEGNLSLSSNGKYVLVAGYGTTVGTAQVTNSDAMFVPRVVGRIDASGNVNTSTVLGTAFTTSNVRGATSTDGVSIWVSGNGSASVGGVHHTTLGASGTTQILAAPNNARFVHAISNQLYGTSGAGTFVNVFTIGNGLPTATGQTATPQPGMPTMTGPSPYSFAMLDRNPNIAGVDTLYVADDSSIATSGGIQRWLFNGATWTLDHTIHDGVSVRGLAAAPEGNGVRIIATTSEGSNNRIVSVFDDGGFSQTVTTIATAAANTIYRGVAFAPN